MRHDGEEAAERPKERKNDRKKTTTANEMKINRKRERNFRKGTVHAHAHTDQPEKTPSRTLPCNDTVVVVLFHIHSVAHRQTAQIRHRKWEKHSFFDFRCFGSGKNNKYIIRRVSVWVCLAIGLVFGCTRICGSVCSVNTVHSSISTKRRNSRNPPSSQLPYFASLKISSSSRNTTNTGASVLHLRRFNAFLLLILTRTSHLLLSSIYIFSVPNPEKAAHAHDTHTRRRRRRSCRLWLCADIVGAQSLSSSHLLAHSAARLFCIWYLPCLTLAFNK